MHSNVDRFLVTNRLNAQDAGVRYIPHNAPARETICAVIVTRNPDAGLCSRIEKIRPQVDQIAIVDNGSEESWVSRLCRLAKDLKVHPILNRTNQGVARALNQGADWAEKQKYQWVLMLDQDTIVAPDMIDSLTVVYQMFPDQSRLAVIGSNYTSSVNGKPTTANHSAISTWGQEVKTVITSGSLVSLQAFQEVGNFRDEFFIDCVDSEYCLRARSKGFRIAISSRPLMQHSIGNLTEHRLPWKKTGTTNHPPQRQYFMARNTVILAREYLGREPQWVLATLWSRAKSLLLVCFFEKQRFRKVTYSLLGILDGIRRKMNRLV